MPPTAEAPLSGISPGQVPIVELDRVIRRVENCLKVIGPEEKKYWTSLHSMISCGPWTLQHRATDKRVSRSSQ